MTHHDDPSGRADSRIADEGFTTAKTIKAPMYVTSEPTQGPHYENPAAASILDNNTEPSVPITVSLNTDTTMAVATTHTTSASASAIIPISSPASPARWGEREPEDLEYPVAHVHAEHLPGATGWHIVGASIRGKMHAHEGRYREDFWHAATTPNGAYTIIAIADGGGSYDLSRIGAKAATLHAIAALQDGLPTDDVRDRVVRVILATALEAAAEGLEGEAAHIAQKRPNTTTKDLSTTLLLVVHHPGTGLLATGQIGDGIIFIDQGDGQLTEVGEAEVGLAAGEVVFLNNTDGNWLKRVQIRRLSAPPRFIAAMTDGLADDVVESPRNRVAFAQGIAENLHNPTPQDALLQLLSYEKRGSFDDRTLVVAYPQRPEDK